MLSVNNIHQAYGQDKILNGISFELQKGRVLALLGQSGSGKSTLLKCLNLLATPNQGTIELDDLVFNFDQKTKISKLSLQKLRTRVGMVFQHFNLWNHLSVIENLTLAPLKVLKLSNCFSFPL